MILDHMDIHFEPYDTSVSGPKIFVIFFLCIIFSKF